MGVPSAFLRTSGCNLRCWFCDTPYTSWNPEGDEIPLDTLVNQLTGYGVEHIVITGGEPVLVPDVVPLTQELKRRGHYITIETAGTVHRELHADLISLSPKLTNSVPVGTSWEQRHQQRRHRPGVIQRWLDTYSCQFKFVVDTPDDLPEIDDYVAAFPDIDPSQVFLMPQGIEIEVLRSKLPWLEELASQRNWRVANRLHIELFGNTRGT